MRQRFRIVGIDIQRLSHDPFAVVILADVVVNGGEHFECEATVWGQPHGFGCCLQGFLVLVLRVVANIAVPSRIHMQPAEHCPGVAIIGIAPHGLLQAGDS